MTTTTETTTATTLELACGCRVITSEHRVRAEPCAEHGELAEALDDCLAIQRAGVTTIVAPGAYYDPNRRAGHRVLTELGDTWRTDHAGRARR